jgi:hypothetical protein
MPARADLVEEVLRELYVMSGNDSAPSAEDDAVVDKALDNAMGELQEMQIAYWDVTSIPYAVMRGLGLVVQGHCARKFIPEMTVQECESMRRTGVRLIREVIAMQSDHQPVPQNYF